MQKKYTIFSKINGGIKIILLGFLSYLMPKNNNLYIFGGNGGNTFSGNSKTLFLYYIKKGYKCFYIIKDKKNINEELKDNFIIKGSVKYYFLYLRSKFIFIDGTLGDIGPLTLIFGRFNIINLWHGDPIKKIWFSNTLHFKKISKFDRFLLDNFYCKKLKISFTGNTESKKNLEDAFHTKHKITGLARYDIFFEEELNIEKIEKRLNIENFNKVILYTPTWRDTNNTIIPFDEKFFNEMNIFFKEKNYIFLIKGHIHTNEIKSEKLSNIVNISNKNFDIQELLNVTDLLITDYSSIYIDFLLTNKPVLFYAYDLKDYLTKDREMYYNYEEIVIKENIIKNQKELIDRLKGDINKIGSYENNENYKRIKDHFHRYQNGGFCERINKEILKI